MFSKEYFDVESGLTIKVDETNYQKFSQEIYDRFLHDLSMHYHSEGGNNVSGSEEFNQEN